MKNKLAYALVAVMAVVLGFVAARDWMQPKNTESTATSTDTGESPTAPARREPVLTLPEFSLKNREGAVQSIRSWPGKSLIVNFWATWCAPCRREIPLLKQLQQQHTAEGVQVVGVAVDFRDAVLKYADEFHVDYPLLIGEQDGLAAVDAFGVEAVGFPFTVFTDNAGDIITTHLGELHQAQATAILALVQKVNRGELPVEKARIQVAVELANLPPTAKD